jgi:hypothetical protein
MRRLLLISVVPLVVACSGPAAPPSAPAAVGGGPASAAVAPRTESQPAAAKPEPKVASQAPSQPKPVADAKPQAPAPTAKPQAPAFPKATIAPPSENHGIALSQPIKSGANGAAILVTNTTDQVMTFTVTMEFRKGADTITLNSQVSDLRPKQSWLAFTAGPRLMPSDPESITAAVTAVKSATPSSEKAEVMKAITVSEPKKVEGTDNVTVEITNNDPKNSHVLSVRSAYMQGDALVAHGEPGSPPRVAPGETITVKVRPVTNLKQYDRIEVMAKAL